MNLQRYDTSGFIDRFHNEVERMLAREPRGFGDFPALSTAQWLPAVDVEETGDAYRISADVPGMKPEDIDITLEKGVLTLKGERKSEYDTDERGVRHVERRSGRFLRRFSLPDTADTENVDARVEQGVLRLTITKKAESKPRRIEVKG